jgi:hypothetical protein
MILTEQFVTFKKLVNLLCGFGLSLDVWQLIRGIFWIRTFVLRHS